MRSGRQLAFSSLLVAALLAAAPAAAATLTRGPYLQLLKTDAVTIVWNTDSAAACAVSIRPIGGASTVISGSSGRVCAIPVAGLTPGGRYGYVPLADGSPLTSESIFQTDDPTLPFSFLVLGDSGCGCAAQFAVRDRMLATAAEFLLHTGDMVYDSGAAADFDPKFFAPYRDILRRVVLWPCLGNHDVATAGGAPWRDAFYTPANNAAGSENYYSFDYGNAHVVVLDSNASTSPGSAQHAFLEQDLSASTATWKFVSFHHTIYSSGTHGSATGIRSNLVPLFDRYGVDIVFMGHDHDYERTYPLRAGEIVAAGAGTVYVTTGGGGRQIRPVGQSAFTAYAESAYHFTRVAIADTWIQVEMVRDDGAVRDRTSWDKSVPLPQPQPIAGKKLLIKDNADATQRKIIFVSKDPSIDAGETGLDPVANGALVQVHNDDGTGESVCMSLPSTAGSWRTRGSVARPGYKYKDREFLNGPCKVATITHGKTLKVICHAKIRPISYSLDEPAQRSVAVHFTSGGVRYCAVFGGTVKRDSGTEPPIAGGKGLFSARDAPAPALCPEPPPCP